jgi:endonuclease-3 related protein
MKNERFRIRAIHHTLLAAYGPQGWWPGDGPFETVVGAILTQNTAWKNVELALERLRAERALESPEALGQVEPEDLERLIRPAGFARRKTRTLRGFLSRVAREPGGLEGLLSAGEAPLRRSLLEIPGIGPETADSILLYAAGRPVFVVDAYTRRLAGRHGLADASAAYDDLQRMFLRALPRSARVMNECHALIVRVGKACCRATPICAGCPLAWDLPGAPGGPPEPVSAGS